MRHRLWCTVLSLPTLFAGSICTTGSAPPVTGLSVPAPKAGTWTFKYTGPNVGGFSYSVQHVDIAGNLVAIVVSNMITGTTYSCTVVKGDFYVLKAVHTVTTIYESLNGDTANGSIP